MGYALAVHHTKPGHLPSLHYKSLFKTISNTSAVLLQFMARVLLKARAQQIVFDKSTAFTGAVIEIGGEEAAVKSPENWSKAKVVHHRHHDSANDAFGKFWSG